MTASEPSVVERPLISVVIPAYNYARTLPRAVESVVAQLDTTSAELLLVNDGSRDDTVAVADALLARFPGRLRVIHKENGGPSSARNRGIAESTGQFLVFLDADDELAPQALLALAEHIASHPQSRFIIGGHCSISPDGRRREHLPDDLPSVPLERLRAYLLDKKLALSNGACAMHRDVFQRGVYPESFRSGEDIPVFAQVLWNEPCSVLAKPLAFVHKHDDSLRHQSQHALAGGLELVDEVFSPQRLAAAAMVLQGEFRVQRCLSLFRTSLIANRADDAKRFFREAVRQDWRVIFRWSYSRKAVRLWLRGGTAR
ncbi:glycosyltransferase family 2 protein [Pseudomonas sp. LRF_L74]|uniref:glycosyltransferase family 2 protein n=1 Tax=Pseudomonas sp. LRF_L74 TaxID=3369422 RepID=UPI003F639AAC